MLPILFSDFDGTFVNAGDPDTLARQRLERAASVVQVVFASSRTVEDLTDQFARLGWTGDCIAENGAEIAVRDPEVGRRLGAQGCRDTAAGRYHVLGSGEGRQVVTDRLAAAAREAGVDLARVVHPTPRSSSLLLYRSQLSESEAIALRSATLRRGLHLADGGDWLAVWSGYDKGEAAARYLDAAFAGRAPAAAAIGNAENDIPLLAGVARAFVIRSPHSGHLEGLARIPGARLLESPGAAGWLEAIELLVAKSA